MGAEGPDLVRTGGPGLVGAEGGGPGLVGAVGGPGLSPPRVELLLATPELDLC